jgi:enoyl-CoA hydratase/carnithine racemase
MSGSTSTQVAWSWASDGVAVVTLTNPPMNVLSRAVLADLDGCLAALATEPARVVVVTGAGERAFSAGADIKEFPDFMAAAPAGGVVVPGQRVLDRLAELPVPTIAAIEGIAFGGGLELALACDLRVAAEAARLGLPETGLGIFPSYGGTQRLPRLVGPAIAKDLIFTGRPVAADEALRLGLVNRIAPAGQALTAALELAASIAGRGGLAVRAAKQAIDQGLARSLAEGQALEAALADAIFQTEDAREGVAAFVAKRPPTFRHR